MKRILISGGGTGGHIFPALSIAAEIRRRYPDAEILFVGAQGRMEMKRVPAAGYEIIGLPVAGLDRHRPWRNFGVLLKLWRSMRQAGRILDAFRPDVAIGVGGYASGPMLKAAQKRGIPTLLQEQNQYAGVTNKLLGKNAKVICTAYDNMDAFFPADRIVKTGNPVRADIGSCPLVQPDAKSKLGFDPARPLVLVVGGSLGARTINEAVARALPQWMHSNIQLLWQTGKNYIDQYRPVARTYGAAVQATDFIADMALAYRAADLVVSRAGAGTISELQVVGAPTILVPSPNVAEDHQRKNARALAERGAAIMIEDDAATEDLGPAVLTLISDEAHRRSMAARIVEMAQPDAAKTIVDQLEKILK